MLPQRWSAAIVCLIVQMLSCSPSTVSRVVGLISAGSASIVRAVSRNKVAKCPDIGATIRTRSGPDTPSYLKCNNLQNGMTCVLPFDEQIISLDDPAMRAEILLLAPSILVPCLHHDGVKVWDTLAIGEYLHEIKPKASLLPADRGARAHCRAICGEMHSGFFALRSALPMNLRGQFKEFKVWQGASRYRPYCDPLA